MTSLFDHADASKRHAELVKKIRHHDALYYQKDDPEISDAEYDRLRQELEVLEKEHPEFVTKDSPTQTVGAGSSSGFKKFAMPCRCFRSLMRSKIRTCMIFWSAYENS